MRKKILVTGGAGYIGSHVVLELLDAGHDVHVLDNLSTGNKSLVDPRATFHECDLHDTAQLKTILTNNTIEVIYHMAAAVRVDESVRSPEKYFHNNTQGSLGVFNCAVECGIQRIIFSSTAAVYGEPDTQLITEETPLSPINPYGASKMMAERILHDLSAAHGFSFAILRYFNVAGADPQYRAGQISQNATHLIKIACEVASGKRTEMTINGTDYNTPDGTCVRDYIHVSDLAAAHAIMLDRAGNAIYNCGYGRGFSVKEVITKVQEVAGKPFKAEEMGRRAGDPAMLVASSDKLRSETGWTPKYDNLDIIVRTALDWENRLAQSQAA